MGGLTGHAVIKSKRLLALLAGNNSLTLHISLHAEPKYNTKRFNKLSYICILRYQTLSDLRLQNLYSI